MGNLLFPEQHVGEQNNAEALPGETVSLVTELPEPGLEVTWLKDNVPLSITEGKYETVNKDSSYELLIPDVSPEDGGKYTVQGGGYESTIPLTVLGLFWFQQFISISGCLFFITRGICDSEV